MNNKITFPELVDLVAQATSTSKRVSELFLKELFATITQALVDGDSVKVKGLGTFKLTEVSPRKSVNVNTGETIEIPGHNKLSFFADKELAEAVNTPFSQFDTVVLDDAVTDEALQAIDNGETVPDEAPETEPARKTETDEAATVAEEAPAEAPEVEAVEPPVFAPKDDEVEKSPVAEPKETPSAADVDGTEGVVPPVFAPKDIEEEESPAQSAPVEPEAEPEPVVVPPPFVQQPAEETEQSVDATPAAVVEEQPAEAEPAVAPTTAEEGAAESQTEDTSSTPGSLAGEPDDDEYITDDEIKSLEKKATLKGFLWGLVVGLIVCAVAGYFIFDVKSVSKAESAQVEPDTVQSATAPVQADTVASTAKPAAHDTVAAKPKPEEKTAEVADEKTSAATEPVYETVSAGNVLTHMANRHYGNQCFWVYIYEENKDKIKDPNNIKGGTKLVIPPAEKYGIDKADKKSVAKAKRKAFDIENNRKK